MYSVRLQVFAVMQTKTHIYTVLTVTTGPLRANIMLIWPSMKMSLTTCYSVAKWAKIEISVVS